MIETDIVVSAGLRITCAKDELAQALGVVSRALSTRTSVQILSGILLEARAGELRLAATDMELSLRASLAAQIEGDGSIVLPGKTFVDIARLLPGDEVTIEHKPAESVVHVTAGSASYTLNTYNP
jgi:DNA polymerase III subunit beta